MPPMSSSRRCERPSQVRTVPAASAHVLSLISAIPAKIAPSAMICTGTLPAWRSTNCGSIAAKNTITLGLVTPTVNPSITILVAVFRSIVAPSASASDWRCLIACTPRNTRYAAPASLSTVNRATDRSTSGPIPNATATTCVNAPTVLPATVATPAPRPSVIARLTVNSTLGPGIAISTNAVTVNASRCAVGITSPAYEPPRAPGHRVSGRGSPR